MFEWGKYRELRGPLGQKGSVGEVQRAEGPPGTEGFSGGSTES